ncbi:hypothetical protein OG979_14000 [Actinomadura citrea]|uniref:hypothetical protein n=1 Tax=Actinomadura citrea TaxID=46158 RepID=UPI002E298D2D|nr:hypothetical protein [Actinomadura citrea]
MPGAARSGTLDAVAAARAKADGLFEFEELEIPVGVDVGVETQDHRVVAFGLLHVVIESRPLL